MLNIQCSHPVQQKVHREKEWLILIFTYFIIFTYFHPRRNYIASVTCGMSCTPDKPYCVEDSDGNGNPGCVAIGDTCSTCMALGLLTKLCDDGSCRGNCGCFWGMNADGDIECQNNIVRPLQCM